MSFPPMINRIFDLILDWTQRQVRHHRFLFVLSLYLLLLVLVLLYSLREEGPSADPAAVRAIITVFPFPIG